MYSCIFYQKCNKKSTKNIKGMVPESSKNDTIALLSSGANGTQFTVHSTLQSTLHSIQYTNSMDFYCILLLILILLAWFCTSLT